MTRHASPETVARVVAALVPLAAATYTVVLYPLGPWVLGAVLAAYAILLWMRPAAFLLILPIVLPAYDMTMWTGWLLIGEADLFVLATLGILLLRTPPEAGDLPRGPGGWILAALAMLWAIAVIAGLASPLGAMPSDIPYLEPLNALRLARSLIAALLLMPFLARRQRTHGDVALRLGQGIACGLAVVTAIVAAERLLYANLLDFSGDYRVAGPFASMHVGGGHIGAYAALALPFALSLGTLSRGTLSLGTLRPRILGIGAAVLGLMLGVYTLAATLARTAYLAGAAGMVAAGFAWPRGRRNASVLGRILAAAVVVGGLAGIVAFTGMRARFADSSGDFTTREGNWQAGLAVRDTGILPTLFGMGLGSYQRAMLVRSRVDRPSDLRLLPQGANTALEIRDETAFFLGQKIGTDGGPVRVRLQAKAVDEPNMLGVSLCDKVLLYSDQCRGGSINLPVRGRWETLDVTLSTAGLGRAALGGLLHRLVEFSVFIQHGRVEVRNVSVTDAAGNQLLANGDFAQGLDRWLFTDDTHVAWRMLNVYLMLLFETGLLGVAAYLALAGAALLQALASARSGIPGAAPVVGAVTAFLVSGLFDDVLEAPRLATLFFLVCIAGLLTRPAADPLTPSIG
ncbi:hypothetical protein [Rhodopila sp.]|uniref:hypothetical protein n=1 Tax=Rhodopila sp. TaxID=2480087 RepID=UPI002C7E80E1|nr:hypothetical protein [Rhodopila sp.]HVZ08538.1 hypothetical protein [Rhodopila sp.]